MIVNVMMNGMVVLCSTCFFLVVDVFYILKFNFCVHIVCMICLIGSCGGWVGLYCGNFLYGVVWIVKCVDLFVCVGM